MGQTRNPLMLREWMSGWRGRRGRREGRANLDGRAFPYFFLSCVRVLLPSRLAHSAPVEVGGFEFLRISLCLRCSGTYPLGMTPLFLCEI